MKLDASSSEQIRGLQSIIVKALPSGLDKLLRTSSRHRRGSQALRRRGSHRRGQTRSNQALEHHSDGSFDAGYGAAVRAIGKTHARIGLEPRWYIGGYSLVVDQLIDAVVAEFWPHGVWRRRKSAQAKTVGSALGGAGQGGLPRHGFGDFRLSRPKRRTAGEARGRERTRSGRAKNRHRPFGGGAGEACGEGPEQPDRRRDARDVCPAQDRLQFGGRSPRLRVQGSRRHRQRRPLERPRDRHRLRQSVSSRRAASLESRTNRRRAERDHHRSQQHGGRRAARQ